MINEKSQGYVAPCLRDGGTLTATLLQMYCLVFFENSFKISQHLAKLWARKSVASNDTQTAVTDIHFASAMPHAKCNNCVDWLSLA